MYTARSFSFAVLLLPRHRDNPEQRIGTTHPSNMDLEATSQRLCRCRGHSPHKNSRRQRQNTPSRRDLATHTRHATRDVPEGLRTDFGHAPTARDFHISKLALLRLVWDDGVFLNTHPSGCGDWKNGLAKCFKNKGPYFQ